MEQNCLGRWQMNNSNELDYLKKLSILYVEDDESIRALLCKFFLKRHGIELIPAVNGAEGLTLFKLHKPDVVITDISMPIMDGLTMSDAIRKINPNTPIILTTGFEESRYFQHAIDLDVTKYVTKPVNFNILESALLKCTRVIRMELALQESEERLRLVLEGAELAFWDWDIVKGCVNRNKMWAEMLGYTLEEINHSTKQWTDFIHPDDREKAIKSIHDTLDGLVKVHKIEYRMLHKDGSVKWVLDHANVVKRDENGKPIRMSGTHSDISEQKQAEIELHVAATVFESQEGMIITDSAGIILKINRAFTKITGYYAADVIGKTPRVLQSGLHDDVFYDLLWESVNSTGEWKGEIWNKRKNGEIYPEWLTITAVKSHDDDVIVTHYVGTLLDITERKNRENQIHQLAFYDSLTDLPNRRLLTERLKQSISIERRAKKQLAVMMMDLDKFKAVNDTFGHAAGDELLKQAAVRIKSHLRDNDTVARLGGDEFVVILADVHNQKDAKYVAHLLIKNLMQPFVLTQSDNVEIGASIGISFFPQDGEDGEVLMNKADIALYQAKRNGRCCFVCYA
jgi:diguanylate cyclase (GGDEF)-like protein/PAS domain S-box-containing protein